MPQGSTGLDSGAWGAEWVNSNDASLFGDRTRGVVEAHYKATLPALQPWTNARSALFDTLMAGFDSLTDFIGQLAGAIAGAVGGTLTNIANFMNGLVSSVSLLLQKLLNAAGEFVANIGDAIIDGVHTVGTFLTKLWQGLTGQSSTSSRTAVEISTAATSVRSTGNTAISNAATAQGTADTAAADGQTTVDYLSEAFGGTAGATNVARTDMRTRGAAVRSTANTGVTNAATAAAAAATADTKAVTATTNAATAQSTANSASTAASSAQTTANTANTAAATADTKAVTAQSNVQTTWNDLYDAFGGTSGSTGQTSASARTRGAAVRSTAVTADTNASTAITNAATADSKAVTATSNAATAQSTANTANTAAGTAQTTANTAKSVAATSLLQGANIATNPGFEDSNLYLAAGASRSYSTEQKRSGTQSMKQTGYAWNNLFANDTAWVYPACNAGDRFYAEIWVYGHASNVDTTQPIYLQYGWYDSSGSQLSVSIVGNIAAGNATKSVWTKLSGYGTVPANGVAFTVTAVQLSSTSPPSNIYYWDDFKCFRYTDTQDVIDNVYQGYAGGTSTGNALSSVKTNVAAVNTQANTGVANAATAQTTANTGVTNAATAQSLSITAMASGSNLLTNFGFENTNFYNAAEFSTEQAYQGSRSLKITATVGNQTYNAPFQYTATGTTKFPALSGDNFYFEMWVFPHTGNSTGDYFRVYIRGDNTAGGQVATPGISFANSTLTKGQWNKISGYLSIGNVPTCANGTLYLTLPPAEGGNIYYIDNAVLYRTTESQNIIDNAVQGVAGGTSTGYTVANLKTNVAAVNTQANTGVTNAATAQTTANTASTAASTADGKAVTAQSNVQTTWNDLYDAFGGTSGSTGQTSATARTRGAAVRSTAVTADANATTGIANAAAAQTTANTGVSNAATAQTTANTAVTNIDGQLALGGNLIPDPDCSRASKWPATASGCSLAISTALYRSAPSSLKMTVTSAGYGGFYPIYTSAGQGVNQRVRAGQTFYAEFWVRANSSNVGVTNWVLQFAAYDSTGVNASAAVNTDQVATSKTAWTKLSGYYTVPAGYDNILLVFFSNVQTASTIGDSYYIDDIAYYEVTAGYVADGKAVGAQGTANTAITNAATADGKAVTADTKALVAQTLSTAQIARGSNLVSNPGFERTGFYMGTGTPSPVQSTEQARTGSYSVKSVHDGSNYVLPSLITSPAGDIQVPATAGDVYYVEAWVYGKSTNVTTTSGVWIQIQVLLANGTASSINITPVNAGLALNSVWTKISGTLTLPANTVAITQVWLVGANSIPAGNTYYWDDAIVREVTNAAAAQTTANTGVTNAAAAQTTANTGVTNAATADGKAVSATTRISYKQRAGSNLVYSPDFEDSTVTRVPYGSITYSYDTTVKHSGTQCLKLTYAAAQVTTTYLGVALRFDPDAGGATVAAGDVFYMECWIYRKATNGSTGQVYFGASISDSQGVNGVTYPNVYAVSPQSSITAGVWTKLSGYVTIPAGYDGISFAFYVVGCSLNDVFYVDDVIVREVTHGQNIIDNTVQAVSGGTATGYSLANMKSNVNSVNTQANTGVTNAATADGKAVVAKSLASSGIASGNNLISDPMCLNSNMYLASMYSTDVAYSGTKSIKTTGTQYKPLIVDDVGSLDIPCVPGDVFYIEMWAYGKATNTQTAGLLYLSVPMKNAAKSIIVYDNTPWIFANPTRNGVWLKSSAYITVPAGVSFITAWAVADSVASGEVYYFSDCKMYRVTEAYAADGKAVVAQGVANASVASGANLCPNPGWESTAFAFTGNSGVLSTEQKYSGTQSLKLTANGANQFYRYVITDTSSFVKIPCKAGDVFYVSAWVFGKSTNVQTSGGTNGLAISSDPANAAASYMASENVFATASTARNGVWSEISGYITMPAGTINATFYVSVTSACANNEVYYFDDIKVYRVTEAYVADAKAVTADTKAVAAKSVAYTALQSNGNFATNPGFESDNVYIAQNSTGLFSTTQKHSGTRSFKMVGYNYRDLFSTETAYIRKLCSAGDRFYIEIWVYGETVPASPNDGIWLQADCYDSAGVRTQFFGAGDTGARYTAAQTNGIKGSWTKMSGYFTAPANTVDFTVTMVQGNTASGGDTWYWDDFACYRVTESQNIIDGIYQAVNGGSSTGNTTASVKTTVTAVNNTATTAQTTAQNGIDSVVSGFKNVTGTGYSAADAASAADETRSSIKSLSSQVTALQAKSDNSAFSGTSVFVDFSTFADSTSLGTGVFSQTYVAQTYGSATSGTSTFGVTSGLAFHTGGSGTNRKGIAIYSPSSGTARTQTIYQKVSAVFGSVPYSFTAGATSGAWLYLIGRSNLAATQYVYARIYNNTARIGYVNGAGEVDLTNTISLPSGWKAKTGTTYSLVLGTSSAASRTFQLLEGTTVIMAAVDSGAASAMTVSATPTTTDNTYAGIAVAPGPSSYGWGGSFAAFAFYDNQPATYRGSGFRIAKSSTTAVAMTIAATGAVAPSGIFGSDQPSIKTDDLTWTSASSKLSASIAGWYMVELRYAWDTALGTGVRFYPILYKGSGAGSASIVSVGGDIVGSGANSSYTTGDTFLVYLAAADYIQPGYIVNATNTGVIGDAAGTRTYFTATFIGNTKPSN